jgi:hypothetical protein
MHRQDPGCDIRHRLSFTGAFTQAGMRKPRHFHVYIMTNGPRSRVLYAGITGDLPRRVFEHKNKLYLASPANTT